MKDTMNEEERKEDEENRKMIEGAKEFSRTIRAMMNHIADLEERIVRLEGMHREETSTTHKCSHWKRGR